MTSPFPIPSRFVRVKRVQWIAALCAAVLSLFAPRAHAAAPLCDPSGASVVAPIPVLPNATGELAAPKSCEAPSEALRAASTPNPDVPVVVRGMDVPERLVATPASFARAPSVRIPRPERSDALRLPGHTLPVYRPPCGL